MQSVDSRWRAFYIYRQSTPNCRLVNTPSARATSTWRDVHRIKKPVGLIEKWQCVSEKILCRDFQTGLLLYENEFAITYFFLFIDISLHNYLGKFFNFIKYNRCYFTNFKLFHVIPSCVHSIFSILYKLKWFGVEYIFNLKRVCSNKF